MRLQGSGVMINLLTRSTRDGSQETAFLASMQGLEGLTSLAARELSPYGIQVYSVESVSAHVVQDVFALLDVHVEER
jgi:NAD(P)-dependent dehydrogenase (short-subunit alcohol dehydrogenase family)